MYCILGIFVIILGEFIISYSIGLISNPPIIRLISFLYKSYSRYTIGAHIGAYRVFIVALTAQNCTIYRLDQHPNYFISIRKLGAYQLLTRFHICSSSVRSTWRADNPTLHDGGFVVSNAIQTNH